VTELHIYQKIHYLLPMYLTQVSAMEWSVRHLNESQLAWLARRNWDVLLLKPLQRVTDSWINRHFCIVTEIHSSKELSFAQLLFADCVLEVAE